MLTIRFLRYWHTRYNHLLFSGALPKPVFSLHRDPLLWGLCWGDEIHVLGTLTREQARATLLHEMIHQWQHLNRLPMDHGRSFKQWRNQCVLLTGLEP